MLKWGASDGLRLPNGRVPSLPHVGFGPNDHLEDALNFTFVEK